MVPQRISAKLFIEQPATLDLPRFIPIFHRWIQESAAPDMLIDVADYKHVEDGPGILLVAHEGDYAIDLARGEPGLRYLGKREWPAPEAETWPDRVRHVLRRALQAALMLEAEPALQPPLRFRSDVVEIQVADRLRAPNRPQTAGQLQEELAPLLDALYAGAEVSVEWLNRDPRRLLTLRVAASEVPSLDVLLQNLLQPVPATAGA